MPRFFIEAVSGDRAVITGADGAHIARSLRMRPGEKLTLCDGGGTDYICMIRRIAGDTVELSVEDRIRSVSEPSLSLTLYQGMPKGDKMDTVVQKAVELGAQAIVPVMTDRSISRPDERSARKKRERWEKIAFEAAKQCGRGMLPAVRDTVPFETAMRQAAENGPVLFFYEGGGKALTEILREPFPASVSIFIGPEGGFSLEETALAEACGAIFATLGPRILRAETAPLAAVTAVMLLTGNME